MIGPLKVLFLDVDGVMNSAEYARSLGKGGMLGINPDQAAMVRRIVARTGCVIVLSSSWRSSAELRAQVRKHVGDFVAVTHHTPSGKRGYEVRRVVRNMKGIHRYAILDDDSDFFKYQPLFKTDWETGLTAEIAEKVVAHLNGN